MATYELLAGTTNVVRFPVEERTRPSLDIMRDIRPDIRVVLVNAAAFNFDPPLPHLRDATDRETSRYIETHTRRGQSPSSTFLAGLLDPVVARAVTLARETIKAEREATQAQRRAIDATFTGRHDAGWLQERATAVMLRATEMGMLAHVAAEQAEGVARAVGLAREGVTWTPRNLTDEDDNLIAIGASCR